MTLRVLIALAFGSYLIGCQAEPPIGSTPQKTIPPDELQSGFEFLTTETQAQQADEFENPGYLWVDRGANLFDAKTNDEKSCSECHSDGLEGVSTSYPKYVSSAGRLLNIEGRINLCRTSQQNLPALEYESEDLLSLTAYLTNQSLGLPLKVEVTDHTRENFERGQSYFYTRRGQFNLSCEQCHVENWGQKLRGDTISQGHPNGFPTYRFEWQTLGSLHRRLSDCDEGVRAEPFALGSQEYIDLEFYLAVRANGLETEAPSIRR